MRKEELVVEEDEDIWRSRLNIEVDFCSILIVKQSVVIISLDKNSEYLTLS